MRVATAAAVVAIAFVVAVGGLAALWYLTPRARWSLTTFVAATLSRSSSP